jgi:phosphonate transport system substrate-binding protein
MKQGLEEKAVRRREFLGTGAAISASVLLSKHARAADARTLLIGTTPVFLDDEVAFLREWQSYLAERLQRSVSFVHRGTYREISELVLTEKIDAAWVCGFPYLRYRERMRLLAVPTYLGKPLYRSYVIVPDTDTRTASILDLRGKIYAFSDPDSNSGWLVPQAELERGGNDRATFFRKAFFTYAHRRVVDAVAAGVAQGGSVDGYVWDTLQVLHPELTQRTRVASKSPEFGFPPLVARANLPHLEFKQLQDVLVRMQLDQPGLSLLHKLNLDGFQPGSDQLFAGIAANMHLLRIA